MSLRNEYLYCRELLEREALYISDLGAITSLPAYREVVGMGRQVIPHILKDLQQGRYFPWFTALHELTGANPVAENDCGRTKAMAEAWVSWGIDQGLL